VARTPGAYTSLVDQLSGRTAQRRYLALAWGHPGAAAGLIDAPIGRGSRDPTRMAVSVRGREARTRYDVAATYAEPVAVSLLRCSLETGRTHQVRVHLAAIGHPVVGDARYGGRRSGLDAPRPLLHAERLGFTHPGTGASVSFESPLPADMASVLAQLR
jgi:23S rRNA pseudouridine1911/1915/1917 synthase